MDGIRTAASRIVYENPWMRVREDRIIRADGSEGTYGVVEKPDFVAVAAIEDQSIFLVEQYRHAVKSRQWELPQGAWFDRPHADPIDVARGELREETGLIAREMIDAGPLFLAQGYSSQRYRVFLARGLSQGPQELEHEEQDLVCRRFAVSEVEEMMRHGTIRDATTFASLHLLRLKGLL